MKNLCKLDYFPQSVKYYRKYNFIQIFNAYEFKIEEFYVGLIIFCLYKQIFSSVSQDPVNN